jgi:hypothetical protein
VPEVQLQFEPTMDRNNRLLSKIREHSNVLQAIEAGVTPAEIKETARSTLELVVTDPAILDRMSLDLLLTEAINVQRVLSDAWSASRLYFCLDLHKYALQTDPKAALAELERWDDPINRGLSQYWSHGHLEHDKRSLALEEFASEVFRTIGSLIEATLQPFLRALLGQVRITRKKDPSNINILDLGNVVQELASTAGDKDLFEPPPWGIPLNQWRNIAQHHGYEVSGTQIRCWYGKPPMTKQITLTRAELWEALLAVVSVYHIIRASHMVTLINNVDRVQLPSAASQERPDAAVFQFATAAASQGFEVMHVQVDEARAFAVLQDVTEGDNEVRQIHASQFTNVLWQFTRARLCEVEYRTRSGTPTLFASADADDCAAVSNDQIEWGEFAARVRFRILRT